MSTNKAIEVAICHGLLKLTPVPEYSTGQEIKVTIGVLEDGVSHPRNFSTTMSTPKASAGDCSARIFTTHDGKHNLFGSYGPQITCGDLNDYVHGVRALKRIAKNLTKIWKVRGPALDAADEMGRWLEACKVKKVFIRPDGESRRSWMNEGKWDELNIGTFVQRVRANLYVAPVEAPATETSTAGSKVSSGINHRLTSSV
jgi:hypothetical protein